MLELIGFSVCWQISRFYGFKREAKYARKPTPENSINILNLFGFPVCQTAIRITEKPKAGSVFPQKYPLEGDIWETGCPRNRSAKALQQGKV